MSRGRRKGKQGQREGQKGRGRLEGRRECYNKIFWPWSSNMYLYWSYTHIHKILYTLPSVPMPLPPPVVGVFKTGGGSGMSEYRNQTAMSSILDLVAT